MKNYFKNVYIQTWINTEHLCTIFKVQLHKFDQILHQKASKLFLTFISLTKFLICVHNT